MTGEVVYRGVWRFLSSRLVPFMAGRTAAPQGYMIMVFPGGSVVPLAGPGGEVEVELLNGSVWVTRRGDPEDHVLSTSGEKLRLPSARGVVVQALSAARVAVRWEAATRRPATPGSRDAMRERPREYDSPLGLRKC